MIFTAGHVANLRISVMNDSLVSSSRGFKKIAELLKKGITPRVLAIKTRRELYGECSLAFARLYLCMNFNGNDNCSSCREWHGDEHPDLIRSGDPDKVPGIDICRAIHKELLLRPVISEYRVALIFGLDRISVNAANSMLKLTEDTPERGIIIFLHANDDIIPTLASRVWPLNIIESDIVKPVQFPAKEEEWLKWIDHIGKEGAGSIQLSLDSWVSYAIEKEQYDLAGRLEKLRIIASNRKLSPTMLSDLVMLTLKEGFSFEHIFGDIW